MTESLRTDVWGFQSYIIKWKKQCGKEYIKHITICVKKGCRGMRMCVCMHACFHKNHRKGKPEINENDYL